MRRSSLLQLWPSAIELGYVYIAACVLLIVGNGKLILERAGFISSAHVIGAQVSTKLVSGTALVDTFRFTASAINFIIWGGTGLIIYSALQSAVQVLRVIEYERDFDSGHYIHPQGYTHQAYWRQIVTDTLLGFALLALLAIGIYISIAIAVPDSFAYLQRFVLTPGFSTAIDPVISVVIAFVASVVLYLLLKLVIRHHRVSKIEGLEA